MYSKEDIEKTLNEYNYFIDSVTLSNFIKNWKVEAIYEDEDGVEFYDNIAIAKLKKGISLKSQGFSNDQIIYHINKLLPEKLAEKEAEVKKPMAPTVVKTAAPAATEETPAPSALELTAQTLHMLSDTLAEKIIAEVKEQISNSEFAKRLLEDKSLKEDNEAMARKIEELSTDNKNLAQRVEDLEQSKKKHLINFEYFKNLFKK